MYFRLTHKANRTRLAFLSLICLIPLSLGSISAGPRPPITPTPEPFTPAETKLGVSTIRSSENTLDAYQLLTPLQGWILLNNHLYQTQTGGTTWTDMTPPDLATRQIRAVSFSNESLGWVVMSQWSAAGGAEYSLAVTSDGGRIWTQRPLPLVGVDTAQGNAVYLQGLDAQTGWIVIKQATSSNFSQGELFQTRDGGVTWTQRSLPIGNPVHFVTAESGWVAGGAAGSDLYHTLDGGETWSRQALASVTSANPLYQLPTFSDEGQGLLPVVTSMGDQTQLEFHRTLDGGATWQRIAQVNLGQANPGGLPVAMINGEQGIVFDAQSQLLTQVSARGTTAFVPHLPPSAQLVSLDMASPDVGWALSAVNHCVRQPDSLSGTTLQSTGECVQEVQLLRTDNGGRDWATLPLPPDGKTTLVSATPFSNQIQPNVPGGLASQAIGGRTQILQGQGFDICNLPDLAALQDWNTNGPYRAINLYLGGSSRACANARLTASYLTQLGQLGWKFIPTWVGPQAACSSYASKMSRDPATAYAEGVGEANAAVNAAANLGLTLADKSGTVIYYDLEAFLYNTYTDPACSLTTAREAAKAFVSGWTAQLHKLGNQAGLYGHYRSSMLSDFAGIANVPDAIWLVNLYSSPYTYRSDATVWLGTNNYLADTLWANHQRIRQYALDHSEKWGSTTLTIDSNVIDGIVATQGDNTPPTVLTQIYLLYSNSPFRDFRVLLNGIDDLSGIAAYDLQYQVDGSGPWQDAITNTPQSQYHFIGDYGHSYTFRARARDQAYNQSEYPAVGDSSHAIPDECSIASDGAESDNSPAEASPLVLGAAAQNHNFHAQADEDWVTLSLQADKPYIIATNNVGGFADTVITLYAPDGVTMLAENDDDPGHWPASRLIYRPAASGTHYLKIRHFDTYGYGCATAYTVTAVQASQTFFPNIKR